MKSILKRELPLMAIILMPQIYLAYIWTSLPDKIPVQWGLDGEVNRYGGSLELFLITLMPLIIYLTFWIIPKIDLKKKLHKMGGKFQNLKIWFTLMMSMFAIFFLYAAAHQSINIQNYLFVLLGFLFIIIGNYFKTIQPNYFLGIRTPWTLENETVWKETHRLAGKIWFVGGLLIILAGLIISRQNINYVMLTIIGIISIIPIVYSYFKFEQIKKQPGATP